jgi:hypothetical protein
MGRTCKKMGVKGNACRILVGKPEGNRLLPIPRRRWVDNFKMDPRELEDRVVGTELM